MTLYLTVKNLRFNKKNSAADTAKTRLAGYEKFRKQCKADFKFSLKNQREVVSNGKKSIIIEYDFDLFSKNT